MISNDLDQNKYDRLNYNLIDGIKIYTGTTTFSSNIIKKNIDCYKNKILSSQKIFSKLVPSTLTVKGKFTNICFNEEDIIDYLSQPSGGYILKICCNYGVIINESPNYTPPPARTRTSNRGRKPKIKKKTKRKLQGSGKYFSSQITFEIYNKQTNKVYKIKLFRNGGFQVPGVTMPDMSDLILPIKILRDYLREEFIDDNIDVMYFISVMRNYICRISNTNILVRLNELETLFKHQKEVSINNSLYDLVPKLNFIKSDDIKEYIGNKNNKIGLAEIQNNCERYFGLILKFYRPVIWKMNKRTTIKVLRSGKINIDGSNNIQEAYELYHWLESIFVMHSTSILYDTSIEPTLSSDYDVGSGSSVYDEDLD